MFSKRRNLFEYLRIKLEAPSNLGNGQIKTYVNLYSYLKLRSKPQILSEFASVGLDGVALLLIFKLLLGFKVTRRSFDMTSEASEVFRQSEITGDCVFFLGSREEQVTKAVAEIQARFPKLNLAGCRSGYFDSKLEKEVFQSKLVKEICPDIIIVGMGTPAQEFFLIDLMNMGFSGKGYTCGGFLHQTSKGIQYYPDWINTLNLRWLFRISDEPKLVIRYFIYYPLSVALIIYDVLSARFRSGE